MKFYESHFEEYIAENNRVNLHPKLEKIYEKFTINEKSISNLEILIKITKVGLHLIRS